MYPFSALVHAVKTIYHTAQRSATCIQLIRHQFFKERIPDGEAYIDVRVVAKVMNNSLSVLKKNSKPTTLEKGFHGFIEIRMEN